jgi:hypothetical protein
MDHTYASVPQPCSSTQTSAITVPFRNLQHGKCIVCCQDNGQKLTVVSLGLKKIRESAVVRNDTELIAYLDSNCGKSEYIHETCRINFNRTEKILGHEEMQNQLDMESNRRRTRCSTGGFDPKTMCILCDNSVDLSQKAKAKRRKVETHTIVENWIAICKKRNDVWSQEVSSRLEFFNNDLVAADAIYHQLCKTRFSIGRAKEAGKVSIGRPVNEIANEAFNMICMHLEKSCENGLYTLVELHKMMVDYIRTTCTYNKNETVNNIHGHNIQSHFECLEDTVVDCPAENDVNLCSDMESENGSDHNNNSETVSPAPHSPEILAYTADYLLTLLKTGMANTYT